MVRCFSELEGCQKAYTLEYAVEQVECGCRLCVRRTGEQACEDSLLLPLAPEKGEDLMRLLYENAVQPELWRDVVGEYCPWYQSEKGGPAGEH